MAKKEIMDDLRHKIEAVQTAYPEIQIAAIFLQGSQNYGMDDNLSDIDAKMFVIPTLDNLISEVWPNDVFIMEDGSHVEIKDIRLLASLYTTPHPTYLEILFTDYFIIFDEAFYEIIELRDEIVDAYQERLLLSISGNIQQKFKEVTHCRKGNEKEFESFGQDVKATSHLYRFKEMAQRLMAGDSFENTLTPTDKEWLMNIKRGRIVLPLDTIKKDTDEIRSQIKEYTDGYDKKISAEVFDQLEDIFYSMIKNTIIKNIKADSN